MTIVLLAVLTVVGLLDWAVYAGSRWLGEMEWRYGREEENTAGAGGDSGQNVEGWEDA